MKTELGAFLRQLRIANGEIRRVMAERLGVSSAFLSAVENGKKKIPENWSVKIARIYGLSRQQIDELHSAIIQTNNVIEINLQHTPANNRELAISFAREFSSLDEETCRKLFEILERRTREDT